jgi:N-acetylglucosaminyl-diphospho-decaprenol L-rhamnosyltransferase
VGQAPVLDVVIVSYRCKELLRRCLESLHVHPPRRKMQIFVVDNGSDDGTGEFVRQVFPGVVVREAYENLGFAKANNHAIRDGAGKYVLALNPDTRVTPGALDHLIELMDTRLEIGIAGCRLELEDGSLDHAAKRSFPTPLGALAHFARIGRLERAPAALAQYRAPAVRSGPVDAVNGAFMLIRRKALEQVGLFDEGYWMYMEDLDLCYRFARAGWVTWYDPAVTVVHLKGATTGGARSVRLDYAFHYGMFRFYRKHYAASERALVNSCIYAGIGAKLLVSLVADACRRSLHARRRPRVAPNARSHGMMHSFGNCAARRRLAAWRRSKLVNS